MQLFQTCYAVWIFVYQSKWIYTSYCSCISRFSKHFTIKVLSSWEPTVEVSPICFGEVPCMLWVSDTNMSGVFDDIEFVDEAVIQTIWKIVNPSSYSFLM